MERLSEKLAAVSVVLFALGAGVTAWLGGWTGRVALGGLTPFHFIGLLVAAFTWMRALLHRRAEEERRDLALAPDEGLPDTRLFGNTGEGEPFSARRSETLFEKYAVPGAAPVLALVQGFFALRRFRGLDALALPRETGDLSAVALLAALAFISFLFGRYLLALARDPQRRVLRPVGVLLGILPLLHLVAAGFVLIAHYGTDRADRYGAAVFAGVLSVLAIEMIVLTVAELYRPRRTGGDLPLPYETRLGRLLAEPTGIARGAGRALDYQFGFRVSETWFYRFLERALLPLLCLQVVLLYGLSSLIILGPEEEAIVERFGRAPREQVDTGGRHVGPGLHLKWPWPFETIRRFPVRRLQSLSIGFEERDEPERVILWTRPHFARESLFLVATREETFLPTEEPETAVPVNLLTYAVRVEFQVTDLYRFLYGHCNPHQALSNIATGTLTRESAGRGLFDVLGEGFEDLASTLRSRIQTQADERGLGVKITDILLQGVHPPIAVAPDFEAVVGAMEEREAQILAARAYSNERLPMARAEALKRIYEAESYRARRAAVSEAERGQFLSRREGYQAAPLVFRSRHYLEALRSALQDARLYLVVTEPDLEVIQLNFEERTPATLFDTSPEVGRMTP